MAPTCLTRTIVTWPRYPPILRKWAIPGISSLCAISNWNRRSMTRPCNISTSSSITRFCVPWMRRIQPRYGTIGNRESLARREFFRGDRLSSVGSHGEESQDAYARWFEEQSSFVEAMRRLTACRGAIGDQHADKVASSVCYELTGHEDLALQAIANGLVRSEPTQQGEIETTRTSAGRDGKPVRSYTGRGFARLHAAIAYQVLVGHRRPIQGEPVLVSHRAGHPAVCGSHVLRRTLHHYRAWPLSLSGAKQTATSHAS